MLLYDPIGYTLCAKMFKSLYRFLWRNVFFTCELLLQSISSFTRDHWKRLKNRKKCFGFLKRKKGKLFFFVFVCHLLRRDKMLAALLFCCALIVLGCFVTSPNWLNDVATNLHLPCRVRVHKIYGFSREEDVVHTLTGDGFIVAYHGRFWKK